MSRSFQDNIAPHVESELKEALRARQLGDSRREFFHLENAHVLGQESTYWHTRVHLQMFAWAGRNRSIKEFLGQTFRVVGALTKTAIGWVPEGNTGGANVSPFKSLPIEPKLFAIIQSAKSNA